MNKLLTVTLTLAALISVSDGAFAIVRDHRNSSTSTPPKNAPPPAAPIGTPATKPPSPTSAAPANRDHRLKNGYTIALEKIQKTPPTLPPGAICSRGSATGTCLVNPVTTTGFPALVYDKATKQLLPGELAKLTASLKSGEASYAAKIRELDRIRAENRLAVRKQTPGGGGGAVPQDSKTKQQ